MLLSVLLAGLGMIVVWSRYSSSIANGCVGKYASRAVIHLRLLAYWFEWFVSCNILVLPGNMVDISPSAVADADATRTQIAH